MSIRERISILRARRCDVIAEIADVEAMPAISIDADYLSRLYVQKAVLNKEINAIEHNAKGRVA